MLLHEVAAMTREERYSVYPMRVLTRVFPYVETSEETFLSCYFCDLPADVLVADDPFCYDHGARHLSQLLANARNLSHGEA